MDWIVRSSTASALCGLVTSIALWSLAGPGCSSSSDSANETDAGAPDAVVSDGGTPVWPDEWSADILWSEIDANGSKSNTWTGHVSYNWKLRAMRTDVVPPEGGIPGPPIGKAGSMLMRNGKIYFIPTGERCFVSADFGAPRPNWLGEAHAVLAPGTATLAVSRWIVDSTQLDGGLQGCFTYALGRADGTPRLFGGSATCQEWPKGSFIEYANFTTRALPDSAFDVPPDCAAEGGAVGGETGCHACHDAPN
ncbi:hypothetical protein LZC95_48170 [Pendulispora brunnea]|uniref:Uncharacterized protein n=1 Tax=Pendulispora brunnea TaxID=2905690 RepID=A0ABZ2K9G8_9BACT